MKTESIIGLITIGIFIAIIILQGLKNKKYDDDDKFPPMGSGSFA